MRERQELSHLSTLPGGIWLLLFSLSPLLSLFIFNCCSLLLLLLLLLLPAVSSSPTASSAACRGLGAGMNAVVNVFLNVMRLLRN